MKVSDIQAALSKSLFDEFSSVGLIWEALGNLGYRAWSIRPRKYDQLVRSQGCEGDYETIQLAALEDFCRVKLVQGSGIEKILSLKTERLQELRKGMAESVPGYKAILKSNLVVARQVEADIRQATIVNLIDERNKLRQVLGATRWGECEVSTLAGYAVSRLRKHADDNELRIEVTEKGVASLRKDILNEWAVEIIIRGLPGDREIALSGLDIKMFLTYSYGNKGSSFHNFVLDWVKLFNGGDCYLDWTLVGNQGKVRDGVYAFTEPYYSEAENNCDPFLYIELGLNFFFSVFGEVSKHLLPAVEKSMKNNRIIG